MCGIAGFIDYSGRWDVGDVAERMTGRLSHRGPDGRGAILVGRVGLGHRRLAIIDLEGGRQPMSTPDGMLHVTFNGEIYNFRQLKKELEAGGHRFCTESDTEVVLMAYRAWGKHCVDRLEGMFAFAVADFVKNEMFLARDPFGIKPLLYRWKENSFAFASEFQSLRALPDWTDEIDLLSIDLYLRFQYIPAPRTAFRKTLKLPAGHRMTVRMGEPHRKIERYWTPDFSDKKRRSTENTIRALDEALRDSVRRHLVSDVPFGALLSGGVDSSLVVGYMSELLGSPVKTFSIGFEDQGVNELHYARQVAEKYGTDHHEEIVRMDALEILPELVAHYGEPFGDQSAIPSWYVCRLARRHVPMVLTGDGGDELFGGYGTYGKWLDRTAFFRPEIESDWKSPFRAMRKRIMPGRCPQIFRPEDDPEHWVHCIGRFQKSIRESLWLPEYRFVSDAESREFGLAFAISQGLESINRTQFVDFQTFLPEDILTKVDIASMRYGLEARPPILDRKFFKIAASIPPSQLYAYEGRRFSGKQPLKSLLARKMGHKFAHRPKQGFELPLQSWLRNDPSGTFKLKERLTDSGTRIFQWFDRSEVNRTIEHGHVVNLWLMLVLEEWLSQIKQNQIFAV